MFKGSFVAIVTPFTRNNEIDEKALFNLASWHIENKTDGIVACGTTGESPTLSDEEKLKVIKICKKASRGKIPIIAGTGSYNTSKSLELTKKAKEIGADGCLIVVPYYNRPTQEGVVCHFKEIAKANLPIICYHHPGRCGINLKIKTFKKILEIKNVVAIKEASGNLDFALELIGISKKPILSGNDDLTYFMMEKGSKGGVSVVANIIPKILKDLTENLLEKKYEKAKSIDEKYKDLYEAMVLETNPQCVKYALSLMNLCKPYMRLPLIEPKKDVKEKIKKVLSLYGLV